MMLDRVLARRNACFSRAVFRTWLFAALLAIASVPAAQNESRWTANVGGGIGAGYTPLLGGISKKLNNGWHFKGGVGYKFTSHFSTTLQMSYHGLGVSKAVLNEAQVPNGNAHVWSFTANPKIGFSPHHGVNPYLIGAVGYYRRVVQFTRPTVQPGIIFDPFFGFFQGFIPADKVLGTIARSGVGGGVGAGFEFGLGSRGGNAKLFTEARYEYAATGAMPTRMVPVTFGVRW
jgi:opacity protein-like surface antigen